MGSQAAIARSGNPGQGRPATGGSDGHPPEARLRNPLSPRNLATWLIRRTHPMVVQVETIENATGFLVVQARVSFPASSGISSRARTSKVRSLELVRPEYFHCTIQCCDSPWATLSGPPQGLS